MKKFIALFIIIAIAILSIIYGYFTFKQNSNNIAKHNLEYEYYMNKEIYGTELATVINKATENNEKFNIKKDNKGLYIDDEQTSIKIQIHILDNNTTYNMEAFYMNGIDMFVKNFSTIKFKCTNIRYHPSTKRVSYLYFEQLSI